MTALPMSSADLTEATEVSVRIDASRPSEAINPFIYGQFIEHLGRCIYGGIWAEMLEDRKFYFPITPEYNPYGDQTLSDPNFPGQIDATEFPVVSASPWEIVGEAGGLEMVTANRFVGEHTPRLKEGTGIRQHDLGVRADLNYDGYIWVRPVDGQAEIEVSLAWGEGEDNRASERLRFTGDDYSKQDFSFTPTETVARGATLEIRVVRGDALVGTASLMPGDNVDGLRRDTLDLLKKLDAPMYRWPGGNFVSGYDWRDGIGDRDRRPPRKNPAWTGIEHNDMGTDEFIAFCRLLGAEPVIAANTGFGDAYSAAQWVEYTNGDASSLAGGWRAENGNEAPFGVRYWCVGNEMWGTFQLGWMQLHHYVIKHNLVASRMWEKDPDLLLIGVGDIAGVNRDHDPQQVARGVTWSEGMLLESSDYMNYISEHFYVGRVPWSDNQRVDVVTHVQHMKDAIREKADRHRELQSEMEHLGGRVIPIAMDEWNYWHRDYVYGELGCVYDVADGLGVAAGLHEFFRNTDIIEMAHYAQTVNVIGAIKTTRIAAEMETTGLVLQMYRAHFGKTPLPVSGGADPYDIVAALSEDGKTLTVGVVNPTEAPVRLKLEAATLELASRGERWLVAGPDEYAHNVPGEPRVIDIEHEPDVTVANGLELPALSSAIFLIPLQDGVEI